MDSAQTQAYDESMLYIAGKKARHIIFRVHTSLPCPDTEHLLYDDNVWNEQHRLKQDIKCAMATHICVSELQEAAGDIIKLDVPNTRIILHRNREHKYRVDLHIPMTSIGDGDMTNDMSAIMVAREHPGSITLTKINMMEVVGKYIPYPITLVE